MAKSDNNPIIYIVGIVAVLGLIFYPIYYLVWGRKKKRQREIQEKIAQEEVLSEELWILTQIDNYTGVNGLKMKTLHFFNNVNGKRKKFDTAEGAESYDIEWIVGQKYRI